MNERIIQLITEADTHAWSVAEKYVAGDGCNDGEVNYLWEDAFREKLVELLVQECLNQCYNRGMNDELYAGQLKAAEYIEEHFGIEK